MMHFLDSSIIGEVSCARCTPQPFHISNIPPTVVRVHVDIHGVQRHARVHATRLLKIGCALAVSCGSLTLGFEQAAAQSPKTSPFGTTSFGPIPIEFVDAERMLPVFRNERGNA